MLPPVPASVLVLFSEFCNCAQPRFSMTCCFGFRKRRGCKPQRREIRLFKQRHPQAAQIASKMLWSVLAASKRTDFLSSLNPAIPQVPTMAMWNETHTVPAVAQHCQSSGSHCRLPWTNIKPSVCLDFFASHYIKFHSREDLASWKRCAWVDLAITFRWFLFHVSCSLVHWVHCLHSICSPLTWRGPTSDEHEIFRPWTCDSRLLVRRLWALVIDADRIPVRCHQTSLSQLFTWLASSYFRTLEVAQKLRATLQSANKIESRSAQAQIRGRQGNVGQSANLIPTQSLRICTRTLHRYPAMICHTCYTHYNQIILQRSIQYHLI